jgi:hypothetical protein
MQLQRDQEVIFQLNVATNCESWSAHIHEGQTMTIDHEAKLILARPFSNILAPTAREQFYLEMQAQSMRIKVFVIRVNLAPHLGVELWSLKIEISIEIQS